MARLRRVIFDKTFDEEAKRIQPNAKRFDEAIDGALWAIASHPEGLPVIDRTLRVAFTDEFPDVPALRIFFSITDGHTCTVHWVERLEPEDEFLGM